jgi:phage terminase large subunit
MDIEIRGFNDPYYDIVNAPQGTQILFGGSSSGKSVFKAQDVIQSLLTGGRNWLCCRNVANTLRTSVFNELTKVISGNNLDKFFRVLKSDMSITCKFNKYQAILQGLDNVEKIKSITPMRGVFTDIWIEEATETKEDDLRQLTKRLRGKADFPKRVHLTFNPIMRSHWIYNRFFAGRFSDNDTRYQDDKLLILKTTYKNNKYLEQDDIDRLEDETDSYFYEVYTLGNWGVLGDLVFTNWTSADVLNDPVFRTFDIFRHGLDFGYSNDPTAYNKMYFHRGLMRLYITHEYNNKGITNDIIAQDIKPLCGADLVVCDSAEPKSIAELCNYGINASGAIKGKDSVNHGIQWLKQLEIIIDKSCQNTINNFQLYHWKKDKDGNVQNVPVDRFNDHIDGIRYAMEDEMLMGDDEISGHGIMAGAQADW